MVGNLVADIEAREATLRDALEDLLALFKRIEPCALKYGAVEQAEQTLKQIPPTPMCLRNGNGAQR
jgi:hypothetical protein